MQKGRRYMRKFGCSFLNKGLLPTNLVDLTHNLEAVLDAMVKSGSISRIGQGRSTRYIKS